MLYQYSGYHFAPAKNILFKFTLILHITLFFKADKYFRSNTEINYRIYILLSQHWNSDTGHLQWLRNNHKKTQKSFKNNCIQFWCLLKIIIIQPNSVIWFLSAVGSLCFFPHFVPLPLRLFCGVYRKMSYWLKVIFCSLIQKANNQLLNQIKTIYQQEIT